MGLLSDSEKSTVSAAVAEAERRTAGELVVVVSERSGDYAAVRAGAAAALTVVFALEATRLFPQLDDWLVLLAQLPFALAIYWVTGTALLLRNLVPRSMQQRQVNRRALRVFLEAGVTETRDRSGVLIYLSEAEHRAVILGDSGIHSRVEASEWQTDVDKLVLSIRQGRPGAGLVEAVTHIGELLATKFPPLADDINELPDQVREI
jgi:putative membrane protein